MNSKLALMPLLIMSAFSYAADEATPETPVQQQLQEVNVRADAKTRQKPPVLTPSPATATCATA